jgi:hypothetical protein
MMKVVLKIEMSQLFWDTFFSKMGQLFRDGGSIKRKRKREKPICPVSVAQLVATRDNLCRGRGLNPGFPTSSHIMCVNLATRLLDKKKGKANWNRIWRLQVPSNIQTFLWNNMS